MDNYLSEMFLTWFSSL